MQFRLRRHAPRRHVSSLRGSGAPFERPGFVAASLGVALLVVAGIVISILVAVDGDTPSSVDAGDQLPTPAPATASPGGPVPVGDEAPPPVSLSSCGLSEPAPDSAADPSRWLLAIAPETSWRDVDVNLAPSAQEVGPGAMHEAGFAYCFQRSPEGALLAAANFLVQSNTPGLRAPLFEYALAPGSHRDVLLSDADSAGAVVRLQIVGYRMLAFDGETARVDVAQRVTVEGATNFIAAVVDLEWVDGDWRIPTDGPHPVRMQALSDVGGYTRWSA